MPGTVKGSVVSAAYDHIRETYGADIWARMMERLSAEDREVVKTAANNPRYPVAVDGRVFAAFVAEAFGGDRLVAEREMRKAGAAQADVMLKGIFSVFTRLASPRQAFLRTGSIVTSIYTDVTHETKESEGGRGGVVILRGLVDMPYVAPWHCGWIECALKHFGSQSPRVIEQSWVAGRNASDELVYEVTF